MAMRTVSQRSPSRSSTCDASRVVAFAEHREEAAVVAFEDALDAGVAARRQQAPVRPARAAKPWCMRLHIASYCAAIRPPDCVPARPSASSKRAASSPRSTPVAAAAACVPNTEPECQPREQHLRPVQRHAHSRADLEAGDGGAQELRRRLTPPSLARRPTAPATPPRRCAAVPRGGSRRVRSPG